MLIHFFLALVESAKMNLEGHKCPSRERKKISLGGHFVRKSFFYVSFRRPCYNCKGHLIYIYALFFRTRVSVLVLHRQMRRLHQRESISPRLVSTHFPKKKSPQTFYGLEVAKILRRNPTKRDFQSVVWATFRKIYGQRGFFRRFCKTKSFFSVLKGKKELLNQSFRCSVIRESSQVELVPLGGHFGLRDRLIDPSSLQYFLNYAASTLPDCR